MANVSAVASGADLLDAHSHERDDHTRDVLGLKLRSAAPAPISTLSPTLLAAHPQTVLRGQVTVTWPISRLKRTVAFVIADPKQVVLRFRGPVARIVGDHKVGAGDEVLVSLEGAELESDDASLGVSLGRSVGWRVVMAAKVQMMVLKHDDAAPRIVDFYDPTVSSIHEALDALLPNDTEASANPSAPEFPLPLTPSQKRTASTLGVDEYMSPAFLKRARVSYGSLFADGLDIFKEDNEKHAPSATRRRPKKPPFPRPGGMWRYRSRSTSPADSEPEVRMQEEEGEIGDKVRMHDTITPQNGNSQKLSASATWTKPHESAASEEAAQTAREFVIDTVAGCPSPPDAPVADPTNIGNVVSHPLEGPSLSNLSCAYPSVPESLSVILPYSDAQGKSHHSPPSAGAETSVANPDDSRVQASETRYHTAGETSAEASALPKFASRDIGSPTPRPPPLNLGIGLAREIVFDPSSTPKSLAPHLYKEPPPAHVPLDNPLASHVSHNPFTAATQPDQAVTLANGSVIDPNEPEPLFTPVSVESQGARDEEDQSGENSDEDNDENLDGEGEVRGGRAPELIGHRVDPPPPVDPEDDGYDEKDSDYDQEIGGDYDQEIGGDYDIRRYADTQDDEEGLGDNSSSPQEQVLEGEAYDGDGENYENEYDEEDEDDEEDEEDEEEYLAEEMEGEESDLGGWNDGDSGSEGKKTPTTTWAPRQAYIPKSPEFISLLSSDDEAEHKSKPSRRPASPQNHTEEPGQPLGQDGIDDSASLPMVQLLPEKQPSGSVPISGATTEDGTYHSEGLAGAADDTDIDRDRDVDGAGPSPVDRHEEIRNQDAMDVDLEEANSKHVSPASEQIDISAILSRPLIPPLLKDLPEPARTRPGKPRRSSSELDPDFIPDAAGVQEKEVEEETAEKERHSRKSTPPSHTKQKHHKGRQPGKGDLMIAPALSVGGDTDHEAGLVTSSPAAQAKARKPRRSGKDTAYVPDAANGPDDDDDDDDDEGEQDTTPKTRPSIPKRAQGGAEMIAGHTSDTHDSEAPSTTPRTRTKPKQTQRYTKDLVTAPPRSANEEADASEAQTIGDAVDPSAARARPRRTRRSLKDMASNPDATADEDDDNSDLPTPGAKTRRSLRPQQQLDGAPATLTLTDEFEPVAHAAVESPARITRSRRAPLEANTPVKPRSPGSPLPQPRSTRGRRGQKGIGRIPPPVQDASILDSEAFSPASLSETLMLIAHGGLEDKDDAGTPSRVDPRHSLSFTSVEPSSPASHEPASDLRRRSRRKADTPFAGKGSFVSQISSSTDDPSIQLARESVGLTSPTPASKAAGRTRGSGAPHQLTPAKASDADPSVQLARASVASRRSARLKESSPALGTSVHIHHTRSQSLQLSQVSGQVDFLKSPTAPESPSVDGTGSLKLHLLKDLRVNLASYTPLKVLRHHPNRTADVVAVVVSDPPEPKRSRPSQDYLVTLTVTDPSSAPAGVTQVQVTRPKAQALPSAKRGDIILLRRFKVQVAGGKSPTLRANEGSAWAVFERGRDDALPQIRGPPFEWVAEEQAHAERLWRWWDALDETSHQKLERAVCKPPETAKA